MQIERKRKVVILATGGTIASRASSAVEMNNYGQMAGFRSMDIQSLVEAVPDIEKIADITGEQVVNIGSARMSVAQLLQLAHRVDLD